MPRADKTNAMRLLDARRVPYVVHTYSPDIHSAEGVAEAVGLPPEQVFKTLVVVSTAARPQSYLAIVPGHREVDLKKLALATGEKKLRMATQREAEYLTGLQVGGISALALLNRGFRVYLDASAQEFDSILVSAGRRGINLQLAPDDLRRVTNALLADLTA